MEVSERDCERVSVWERVEVEVAVPLELRVLLWLAEPDSVADSEEVLDIVPEPEAVVDWLTVSLDDADTVCVCVCETVLVAEREPEIDGVDDWLLE